MFTLKMLQCSVLQPLALKEPSDCKEVLPLMRDVLTSATTISGGQCVMMDGTMEMPLLPVYSWAYQVQVSTT